MESNICQGFKAGGVSSGLKKNKGKDLGIIISENSSKVAGVFTKNIVKAAPVLFDMEQIKSGRCRAIIANSGNANCCTGNQGMKDAVAMAALTAKQLDLPEDEVLVASTGVIGEPLDLHKIERAVPGLAENLSHTGFSDFSQSILTTDTVPKIVTMAGEIEGKPFTITGIAKGSGMIRPDMATMLAFVLTDVDGTCEALNDSLKRGCDRSFNRIIVDGDTSTNDTVLLLANGMSGASIDDNAGIFDKTLEGVLIQLAKMIVKDGEGATKLVEVEVKGAKNCDDALKIADTISHSSLVKTAIFGEDANWGRILAAAGRAGVVFNPHKIDIWFDDVKMVENGMGQGKTVEAMASKILKKSEFSIIVDLKSGRASEKVYTCDLSMDYIKINADYRS